MNKYHPLLKQADEILKTIEAFSATYDHSSFEGSYINNLINSARVLYVKTGVAVETEMYILAMQNAALVREEGQHLLSATSGMKMYTHLDQDYVKVLRKEILEFQRLFVEWVKTLKTEKDTSFTDEWGLF